MGEYELVICIVNQGFTEIVMDAARSVGATGGTIIKARGAGSEKAGELFGITFQHEKERVVDKIQQLIPCHGVSVAVVRPI